jgi:hypothetical protein
MFMLCVMWVYVFKSNKNKSEQKNLHDFSPYILTWHDDVGNRKNMNDSIYNPLVKFIIVTIQQYIS